MCCLIAFIANVRFVRIRLIPIESAIPKYRSLYSIPEDASFTSANIPPFEELEKRMCGCNFTKGRKKAMAAPTMR